MENKNRKKTKVTLEEIIPSLSINENKSSSNIFEKIIMPSDNDEMKKFIEKNKIILYEKVLEGINFALDNNLEIIEIFGFTNSNFTITLTEDKNFRENVEFILETYLKMEMYENCISIKNILNKIKSKELTRSKNEETEKK